jgi:hypothetical protein
VHQISTAVNQHGGEHVRVYSNRLVFVQIVVIFVFTVVVVIVVATIPAVVVLTVTMRLTRIPRTRRVPE